MATVPLVSGSTSFPLLSEPGEIGPLALRNRMLLCPMGDNLAQPGGEVSDRQLAYYEARAAGGAALLLLGSVGVATSGRTSPEQTGAHLDDQIDGLRRLTETVHGHGAAIAAQLVHCGPNAVLDIAEGRPLLVPSIPPPLRMDTLSGMVTPDELTAMTEPFARPGAAIDYRVAADEDLVEVVGWFADAASRLRRAGFDGIEVHAGHGYLIDAFLSPLTNRRTDGWGGPVERRARLLIEILGAVRASVGHEVAVWLRLNGREIDKAGGETIEEAVAVARLAVAVGADAIHVSAYADPGQAVGITAAHTPHSPGARVADAAAVRASVDVPVITFGRLEPPAAEAALATGAADFVAFGRSLLAGPGLPSAIVEGTPERARPCAYQYRCIGNIFLHRPLTCAVSPDATNEVALVGSGVAAASEARHLLVVGGGPVGLEVAHRLAGNGHRVTLWEAAGFLGGTLALAGAADAALAPLTGWLSSAVDRTGVDVELRQTATAGAVGALAPDRVLVVTGAEWARPADELDLGTRALTPDDLWLDPAGGLDALGERVLVVGSGKVALSLASAARARGRTVVLTAPDAVLAPELGLPGRFRLVHDLIESGVDVRPSTVIEHRDDPLLGADSIVWATSRRPRSALAAELRFTGLPVDVLGDASGTFGLEGGLAAAARAAASLGRVVPTTGSQ